MREVGDPLHGGAAQVRMQIAQMQNGEAVESAWQIRETHGVAPQLHLARVCPAPPIRPCQAQPYLDHGLHQGHVLQVQEVERLAKSLLLVLALDAETQPRVQRSKSAFETALSFVGIQQLAVGHDIGPGNRTAFRAASATRSAIDKRRLSLAMG